MPKESSNRYSVAGNVEARYVDEAQSVLVNKRGITDLHTLEIAEEEALANAYGRLVGEVRAYTPMTCELLLHAHRLNFGDLYEWAGRWRTVTISKPGVIWPPPNYLDQAMAAIGRDILSAYPSDSLTEEHSFCQALGQIQGEFLAIHPFREGNARTIKLLTDLLSLQTGRPPLAYDQTESGVARYIDAARSAIQKEYGPMAEVIRQALAVAEGRTV
ncbi:MAG: Fic family protein [Planctomycetota bacterium]